MLKVAIVTHGPYGERAYDTIKKVFKTSLIRLDEPNSTFICKLELSPQDVEIIVNVNILILYTTHPDVTQLMVERFAGKVDWIIVAAWSGEGFKNQFKTFDNLVFPYVMCELEEINDPVFDEFVSCIGKPEVEFELENGKIKDLRVLRCSPCGSTQFVAEFLKNKYQYQKPDLDDIPREAGLKLQHYPCRASMIRLFTPEECKKDKAAKLHHDAFYKAIKYGNKD